MRRLLPAIVTLALALGLASTLAEPALAGTRLPRGVARVSVTLTFWRKPPSGSRKGVHRTLTRAATVAEVVAATNALAVASRRVVCPMFVRLGPVLTVIFRSADGAQLAEAEVQVVQGSHGYSGSSPCFPIRLISSGRTASLLGNGWVRLIGRLIGTTIS